MSLRNEIGEVWRQSPSPQQLRQFGWVVGGAFVALWAVLRWVLPYLWAGKGGDFAVLWWIGGALIALGTVVPKVLKPVFYLWMSMAAVLGFVMTRVILSLFFFIVLTPVGLVFRLIGRDALHRRLDRDATTYWIDKKYPIADRTRFEKFF